MSVVRYEAEASSHTERWVQLMGPAVELAKAVANTDFVPAPFRGKPAEITAAIMYGDEVGLGPLQSLAKIAVINGRPTLAAEAQRGLIQAAGHEIWVEEATTTRVTVGGRRKDSDRSQLFTWTLDDAKRAGIAGKQPWRQYPRAMLLARASAELARAVFADVIGGLAATEELEELAADAPAPAGNGDNPAAPPAPTTRRRRKNAPAATVSAPPVEAVEAAGPELPPLPGEDEPAPPDPASDAQRKKLHVLFREHQIDDRDERLAYCSNIAGRIILGSVELTKDEASRIIDTLEQDPAAGLAEDPPTLLEQPLVSPANAEILNWMRNEAGVDETWMRAQLLKIGVENPPSHVTLATLRTLTEPQARRLRTELNSILDAQAPEDGR